MAEPRLRVAVDANVIVAGVRWPRWPHEVLRSAFLNVFDLVLVEQVIEEARRHLTEPAHRAALEYFLGSVTYEQTPMPSVEDVRANHDLVRDESDVPIALALIAGNVDIFVTSDRDFTAPDGPSRRFRER